MLSAQKHLRVSLLDRPSVRYKPARDLAAHMLLHLDDLADCWAVATHWLQSELACHRVDTGFGDPSAKDYFPGFAEAKASDHDVPSFAGQAVDNRDGMMQSMWGGERPLVYADIKHDPRVSMRMRQRMSGAKTKSKMAWALQVPQSRFGLICADWTEHLAPQNSDIYDCFEQTVADVLGPIIFVAKSLKDDAAGEAQVGTFRRLGSAEHRPPDAAASILGRLTPSEAEVAILVAKGISYKEIARLRGRSFSTIDHQLRSIRDKTGSATTAALIHLLSRSGLS